MLRILHTADWHLGYISQQLAREEAKKLARARLKVVERILGVARRHDVQAILCAGDLFDTHDPEPEWWKGLAEVFQRHASFDRPVLLLPGNHDPLMVGSVYTEQHPFRRQLPPHVHVVDRKGFSFEIAENAVVLGAPCTSKAGDADLALALPPREPGDERIRIGLVHGSTFDLPGFETNFPIAKDAAERRGLDYLAIGDTHSLREIVPGARAPTFYPGAPEPTCFGESDAGSVIVAAFRRSGLRPLLHFEPVAHWTWRDEAVSSMARLRTLREEALKDTVLRLRFDLDVTIAEKDELDRVVEELEGSIAVHGRAGALVVDRTHLRTDFGSASLPDEVPEVVREAERSLKAEAAGNPVAQQALLVLYRLARDLGA